LKTKILLTFDLEEFDLPHEFGCTISDEDQINISNIGLQRLIILLSKYNIPATFFTTAFYANRNEEIIKTLSENHEIASHSKDHSDFRETDPLDSKVEIERITGKKVYGFRMPHFKEINLSLIKAAGYSYDSSINPTLIPGRYCNLLAQRKIYIDSRSNLIEIPVSVSPLLRFPLFWISFKNIPLPVYLYMCKRAMWKDSYLHLYFHAWEFAELEPFKIPWYIKTISGNSLLERFEKLIVELKEKGDFSTLSGFLDTTGYLRFFS
jgi:peptidoglycan/xylan/chitin deacetylase (PgdA/CDA1 family)